MTRTRRRIDPAPAESTSVARDLAIALVVAVLTFLAFTPALGAEFVNYDDESLIVAHAQHLDSFAHALPWAFGTTEMGHWQPLTWLSWAVDFAGSGVRPEAFHRTNLLLHAATAAVLFGAVRRLFALVFTQARPLALSVAAALAALGWSLHPLRVESVAWATERRDVLSGLFLVTALYAHLRAVTPGTRELARGWNRAAIVCLVLSLLSKAWGMTFGVLLVALDVFPLRRLSADPRRWVEREQRAVWLQKLPHFVCGAAAAGMAFHAQASSPDTVRGLAEWGVLERVTQACHGLAFYVAKTIWPTNLVAVRELPYHLDPTEPRFLASFAFVALAATVIVLARRRAPALALAAVVYVVTLAPVLGFVQSGPQLVADRYSYLSCMPWSILLCGAVLSAGLSLQWLRGLAGLALVVLGIAFGATRVQTHVWRDTRSLWEHAFACDVPSSIACLDYGVWLADAGRRDEALAMFERAVAIRPDQGRAWFALGNTLKAAGRFAEAEPAYQAATRTMVPAYQPWSNLGNREDGQPLGEF